MLPKILEVKKSVYSKSIFLVISGAGNRTGSA